MAIYVVMEAAEKAGAEGERPAAYVRDGFSLLGFLFPAIWLLWHRLWIEGALALAALLCLTAFGGAVGLGGGAALMLSLAVRLYVALEGPALRVAVLRRRGWREWGVVRADNRDEAETRHLVEADAEERAEPVQAPREARPWTAAKSGGPAMGLLGYPGGR